MYIVYSVDFSHNFSHSGGGGEGGARVVKKGKGSFHIAQYPFGLFVRVNRNLLLRLTLMIHVARHSCSMILIRTTTFVCMRVVCLCTRNTPAICHY